MNKPTPLYVPKYTGAEAVENAVKIARAATKNPLLTFSPSQGGWSWAPASAGVHGRAAAVDLRVGDVSRVTIASRTPLDAVLVRDAVEEAGYALAADPS